MYSILYNIAMLLSLSIFFATYPFKRLTRLSSHQVIVGVVIGFSGILVMLNPLVITEGLFFDSRTILLVVSGMVFGAIPTLVGAAMMIIYRLTQGGSGIATGLSTITVSSLIGIIWHRLRFEKVMQRGHVKTIELVAVGVVTHIFMLLALSLIPASNRGEALRQMVVPTLVFYPLGTYLLSLLLFSQAHRITDQIETEKSERLFKTMFEQAPIGMSSTDLDSGKIMNINQSYLDLLGYQREEVVGRRWEEFTHPEDLVASANATEFLHTDETGVLNLDKRLIRKDGAVVWLNLSLSAFATVDMDHRESLGMAVDVTERKNWEQRILWASDHDALTGLYNRVHFENFVQELEMEHSARLIVAFLDVNGLKLLNEAFGRDEGNRLLARIAEILQSNLIEGDYLSRVGGDEFAIFFFDQEAGQVETFLSRASSDIALIDIMGSVAPSVSWGTSEVDWSGHSLNDAIKEAEMNLASRKVVDSPNMRGKAVYAIINTLYEKNQREELHSRRVSELCEKLARAHGMGQEAANEIRLVGLLHDIGKIGIDEALLNKTDRLDADEWKQVKRHCEIGYRLLSAVEDMAGFAHHVLYHHERFDGTGYPKGIKGEEIPLGSRIITIADAFDAMTASRTYRVAISSEAAAREIKQYAGTQFDPHLAKTFVEHVIGFDWDNL